MRRTAAVLVILITTSLGTSQACDSPPCNQTWTGILSGIGNLALQPLENLRQVRDYVTGNTYSDYINKTRRQRASQNNSCTIPVAGTGAEHVEPLAKSVRASACSCRPWGNCSPSLCNCGVLCPDSFDILSIHGDRNSGSPAHEFLFRNNSRDFGSQGITNGYCWGHASMTAKFNRLGFFNPGRAISAPASSRQWRDHYRNVIRRIRNNEATDIPGFANLREFSEHPSIQEMIKDEIKDEWGSKAMTFGGLGVALQSKAMSPASSRSLVSGLVHRIANYQSPQIVFTMRNQAFDTHTVLASAVRRQSDGSTWICLRDNNSSGDNRKGCDNRLIVHETGEVSSTIYGDIGGVVVGANENADTVAQIHSLVAKCRGDKKCGS